MAAVRERYADPMRFSVQDPWHAFLHSETYREIERVWNLLGKRTDLVVLNAGAGNHDLGFLPAGTINVDICRQRVATLANPIIGTVEALPLADNCVDLVICVGGVINYCDAAAALSEFGRVVRPGGYLLLEFENSHSAELLPQKAFGASAAVAETFYASQPEAIWVYSLRYITSLLKAIGFRINRRTPIHVLSPWALLLTKSVRLSAVIGHLDSFLRRAPILTRWASNQFLFCQRNA